jgi:hypothetical protein
MLLPENMATWRGKMLTCVWRQIYFQIVSGLNIVN